MGSPTEWTISTLKEHFERLFRDTRRALKLQAREYKRRLHDLNGEQSRIAKSQETYVGRELWDRFLEEDREWKRRIELLISSNLPRTEFQTYKTDTDKALVLKAGQQQGVGMSASIVFQIVTGLAAFAAIIIAIVTVTKAH